MQKRHPPENKKVDDIIAELRAKLEEDRLVFKGEADGVADQDVWLFEQYRACVGVVQDLRRLERDQGDELARKLDEAEEIQVGAV
jgi:isopentenyl phosphate kinase